MFELYNDLKKKNADKAAVNKRTKEAAAAAATATAIPTPTSRSRTLVATISSTTSTKAARRNYVGNTIKTSALKVIIRRRTIANT